MVKKVTLKRTNWRKNKIGLNLIFFLVLMSYRELRDFCEILRCLRYSKNVTPEDFRVSNFKLVADILTFLVELYEPTINPRRGLDYEDDRVFFIKYVTEQLHSKLNIRLNGRKLYEAKNGSVHELLKIGKILYKAHHVTSKNYQKTEKNYLLKTEKTNSGETREIRLTSDHALKKVQSHVGTLRNTRAVASELSSLGVNLFDKMEDEAELKEIRTKALNTDLNLERIGTIISNTLENMRKRLNDLKNSKTDLNQDLNTLEKKLEKKEAELQRNEKRLAYLETVRPAFMDEYEVMETKIAELHRDYVVLHQNVEYLEHQYREIVKPKQAKRPPVQSANRQYQFQNTSKESGWAAPTQGPITQLVDSEDLGLDMQKVSNQPKVKGSLEDNDEDDESGSDVSSQGESDGESDDERVHSDRPSDEEDEIDYRDDVEVDNNYNRDEEEYYNDDLEEEMSFLSGNEMDDISDNDLNSLDSDVDYSDHSI
eukprot:TRINITY_DN2560_c0_g2_i1.p1 TRINITY_DN2560_c0_g2~~TRINITY_DN2560_c0_g2_i1.p1  ORF type:complete len:483 (+),score=159.23 TRINITY_DN2560_c0_g2_i1:1957-3405(+)